MKSALLFSFSSLALLMSSCTTEPKDQDHAGIMVTGNTITVGQDTFKVEVTQAADTTHFYPTLRTAASYKKPYSLDSVLNNSTTSPAQAWDFKEFSKSGQIDSLSQGQAIRYLGNPKWSNFTSGVIYTDSSSILSLDHNDLQNSDSLSIEINIFSSSQPKVKSVILFSKGQMIDSLGGYVVGIDSLGYLYAQFKNENEIAITVRSQDTLNSNSWSKIALQKIPGRAQISINNKVVASGIISAQKNHSQKQLLIAGDYQANQIIGNKSFVGLIDFLAILKQKSLAPVDSMIDARDGKIYKTVKIGNQTWMAQNLNYTPKSGNSFCYNNDSLNCKTSGRLYDWPSAITSCPIGWHLSSEQEWMILEKFLGETDSTVQLSGWRGNAGSLLKDASIGGLGNTGLNLIANGTRRNDGTFTQFGQHGQYWTSTEYDTNYAWFRNVFSGYAGIYKMSNTDGYGKDNAFSVRCIKN
jgi:uncharacterized protein (TIGR02145 family)